MYYIPPLEEFLKREWNFEAIPSRHSLPGWGLYRWNDKYGFDRGWNCHPEDLAQWAYKLGVEHGKEMEWREREQHEYIAKRSKEIEEEAEKENK